MYKDDYIEHFPGTVIIFDLNNLKHKAYYEKKEDEIRLN